MKADLLKSHLKANCLGRKWTVPGSALEHTLHLSGNELRKHVNSLRRQGVPIASSRDGYFYAANAGEIYATIRQLRQMEKGLHAAIEGLAGALELFGAPAEAQRSGFGGETRSDEAGEFFAVRRKRASEVRDEDGDDS